MKYNEFKIKPLEWVVFIGGCVIVIFSFMWNYILFIIESRENKVVWTLTNHRDLFNEMNTYMPEHFNWWLFGAGEGLLLFFVWMIYKRKQNRGSTF